MLLGETRIFLVSLLYSPSIDISIGIYFFWFIYKVITAIFFCGGQFGETLQRENVVGCSS